MNPLLWPVRRLANGLGLAWWAKVQTQGPAVTYWFGPFLSRQQLQRDLPAFLDDLRAESPEGLEVSVHRLRRGEPLTEGAIDQPAAG